MIDGFEKYTYELTAKEKREAKAILSIMSRKKWVNDKKYRGRKIIHYLRINNYPVISSGKGNWLAKSPEEIDRYLRVARQRVRSIQSMIDSLEYTKKIMKRGKK